MRRSPWTKARRPPLRGSAPVSLLHRWKGSSAAVAIEFHAKRQSARLSGVDEEGLPRTPIRQRRPQPRPAPQRHSPVFPSQHQRPGRQHPSPQPVVATSVATSRSSDPSVSSDFPDESDVVARSGRIGHPGDKVEGLVRDNRVEVRVLFGALTKALRLWGFRRFWASAGRGPLSRDIAS